MSSTLRTNTWKLVGDIYSLVSSDTLVVVICCRCPNLVEFTEHFNKMSYWCRNIILKPDDPAIREKYFIKLVHILKVCILPVSVSLVTWWELRICVLLLYTQFCYGNWVGSFCHLLREIINLSLFIILIPIVVCFIYLLF